MLTIACAYRCGSGKNATNNDPRYRTYNRNVTALSPDDVFRWNPWRSPGSAPVYDPCGMAGGGPTWVSTQLSFINTSQAKQGDRGSQTLPKLPPVQWHAGSVVEAKWSIRANHGGASFFLSSSQCRRVIYDRGHFLQNVVDSGPGHTYVAFSMPQGYMYRLCRAENKLTESCFQDHPIEFAARPEFSGRWKT